MTIFDLPALDPAEALTLARATLAAHPVLIRIYDEPFIVNLIRRKGAYDNILLLRLVQPDDEMNAEYWTQMTDDLLTLESEGSFDAFRAKLREHEGPAVERNRTELLIAAWLKRRGVTIALEPQVGTRKCEFVAETTPRSWWEIKSPLDLPDLRRDAEVQTDVHRRLRSIDQPYILGLAKYELAIGQVPEAVKEIKRQLYAFHRAGGMPPRVFEAKGLVISVDGLTKRPKGYLGSMMSKPHMFGNEQPAHIVKRILDAVDQIPAEGGGVVVIDQTSTDWIDHEDVVNACYGEEQTVIRGGQWLNCRLPGAFDDLSIARVSAVVSYTRRWRDDNDKQPKITLLHNPNALFTLPPNFLDYEDVQHTRRVAERNGFRLVTMPDDEGTRGRV